MRKKSKFEVNKKFNFSTSIFLSFEFLKIKKYGSEFLTTITHMSVAFYSMC